MKKPRFAEQQIAVALRQAEQARRLAKFAASSTSARPRAQPSHTCRGLSLHSPAGRPVRLRMMAASSAGSAGFDTCMLNPADSNRIRSSTRL
jgi:hypothetical protein